MPGPARRFQRRVACTLVLLLASLVALAQPAKVMPTIGVLFFRPITETSKTALQQGLADHGYVEGKNIRIEWRSANGQFEAARAHAVDLVGLKVDVIVAEFTPAAQAAQRATQTIPIVMAPAGDPVAVGLVLDLAHPGGNVTGFSNLAAELAGKRLDILRRLVPGLKAVGLLLHGSDPLDKSFVKETRDAASAIGIATETIVVSGPGALDAVMLQMKNAGVRALIVPGNLPVTNKLLASAALRHRLPSVSLFSEYADEGGLVAYGADIARIQRRAGEHVDRILKGARPADIPIEGPTKFELVVNVRTGKALGIQIPPSMLLQADRVIE